MLNNKILEIEGNKNLINPQNAEAIKVDEILLELQSVKSTLSEKELELINETKLHLELKEQFKIELDNKSLLLQDQKSKINELIETSVEMQTACLLHNEELANERSITLKLRGEMENLKTVLREKEIELMECKASFLILKNDFDRVNSELIECSGLLVSLRNEIKESQLSSTPLSGPIHTESDLNYNDLKSAYDSLKSASSQLKIKAQSKISELKNLVVVLQAELEKLTVFSIILLYFHLD